MKMLNWLRRFNIFCFLESHHYEGRSWDWMAGAGVARSVVAGNRQATDAFVASERRAFGHLCFELNHAGFGLESPPDSVGFAPSFLFAPQVFIRASGSGIEIEAEYPDAVWAELERCPDRMHTEGRAVTIEAVLDRGQYVDKVQALLGHIHRGDCYEINFCQEFRGDAPGLDPFAAYERLSRLSPTPYGAFYRNDESYLLCASPERFLNRSGNLLRAQPIKGTAPRRHEDASEDKALREGLLESAKERAENVMVVDLLRNDLSRVCRPGTVRVTELFGLYTFPQVHQMISTIEGELYAETSFSDIIEATFPMGSMTGAPKQRVLELIRQYEPGSRGLFSGSIGYFEGGDFDLNVVIRSLLYNANTALLSYQVGSGITAYCDPEAEWEECMLKGAALQRAVHEYRISNNEYRISNDDIREYSIFNAQ